MKFSGLVADQTYLIKYAFVEAIGGEWVETQGTHEVPYEGLAEYLAALAVKQKTGIDGTFQVTSLEITFIDDCPPSKPQEEIMAVMFQVEVDYFEGGDEHTDIIQVKEYALAQWLRDMASDIEQEGLKILGISITVSGILPAA